MKNKCSYTIKYKYKTVIEKQLPAKQQKQEYYNNKNK